MRKFVAPIVGKTLRDFQQTSLLLSALMQLNIFDGYQINLGLIG